LPGPSGPRAYPLSRPVDIADHFPSPERKLALMPFELSNPVWVEDEGVDLDYHVRRVTLPRPGTLLLSSASSASARPPRRRPAATR